ncbi:MAG: response regulator [Candidatus Zophobacter franzmannii]|nr:response regulator [Candidatus Zophobacter franzmannii]
MGNRENLLSMKIYVADDDRLNLKILKRNFKDNHFIDVTQFISGKDLVAGIEHEIPDLVLLDILMPDMDGYEVLERIKDYPAWNHVPVIMITGVSGADELDALQKSFEKGAMDYITKPYRQTELILRVKSALTLERQRKELQTALATVKRLENLLPICSYCKKIRNDSDYWEDVEVYITEHTDTMFSHSICPSCYEEHVKPQLKQSIEENRKK